MSNKKVPEAPSASLADIAFMLLIFFLVTTTMDVDSGLERRLPQWVPEDQQDDSPPIKDRNVFEVLINKDDLLLVEKEPCRIEDLKERTKEFLTNPRELETLPQKVTKEVPFFGPYSVLTGSAVISLQNDLSTTYGVYIQVQNELIAAINELRDDISNEKFGKPFGKLTAEQQDAVKEIYPQKISEAEPKEVGGK